MHFSHFCRKNISSKIFQYKFNNEVAETDAEPRGIFWNQDEEASEDNPGIEGNWLLYWELKDIKSESQFRYEGGKGRGGGGKKGTK